MKKTTVVELDFVIDCLTNSIRNTISGDSFNTDVIRLTHGDLNHISKRNKWLFDWKTEWSDNRKEIYKLTIVNNPHIPQGLMSLSIGTDHVFIHLLENAPFNLGKNKLYEGVAGNLVAYACKTSFHHGFEGYVSFTAKTNLIKHYKKTLNAELIGSQTMIINTIAANILIDKYFKGV
ncbi:MAG: hypothetical protein LBP68_02655 [Acidobacteriota bacterium]|nr:hypothetical protein [Acidobacteriota bacterium]